VEIGLFEWGCGGVGRFEFRRLFANGVRVADGEPEADFMHIAPHVRWLLLESFFFLFEGVELPDCYSDGAAVVLLDWFSAPTAPLGHLNAFLNSYSHTGGEYVYTNTSCQGGAR